MRRVACLYLPHWPIDRLRRADRARPDVPAPAVAPDWEAIGQIAAAERADQCSVPKEGGWRPGARWARTDPARPSLANTREEVAVAVESLPPHRRPPQRELGRVSEATANPFAVRELSRRTEAAVQPFAPGARGGAGDEPGGWPNPAALDAAIAALPAHQRPSFGELSRRSEVVDNPFRPLPPDEVGARAATFIPVCFPGEDAPAKAARGVGTARARHRNETPTRPLAANTLSRGAAMPPVQYPGEDVPTRRAIRDGARRRPTSRDGHGGEAGHLPPLPLAASLARAATIPAVQYPGEGPHPDNHGRSEPTAPTYGQGRFFQTGRTLRDVVARVVSEREEPLPSAPVDADAPLVTYRNIGGRVEIAAACPAALALGLTPGLALTQARAAVPGLDVRPADPAGDAAQLARLATALARRWTPTVAPSGEDGLLLDVSGVAHLHGGEARMARRLVRLLARRGFTARVAVADTAGAAWALARFGSVRSTAPTGRVTGGPQPGGNGQGAIGWAQDAAPTSAPVSTSVIIVPPGAHVAALELLSPVALRLEPAVLDLLARLGVDRVGQLLAMPRAPLERRFGRSLVERLDQATGRSPEPLTPIVLREKVMVEQRFAEPIATMEAITCWLAELAPRLEQALAAAGLGARVVELVAERVDGVPQRLRLGFARPVRDSAHLLRIAARRIEEIDPGYGVDGLALLVRRADPLGPEPFAPRLAEDTPPDLSPLVDALANRIGPSRLWRVRPMESEVPERSVATAPPLDPSPAEARALAADDVRRLDRRTRDHPWHPRWPRPVLLLRHPERVDNVLAELPDRPPARFAWRGRTHRVVHADGPERIAGEWWRRPAEAQAVRDYYHVENEAGERFWLYRRGDGLRAETGDLAWFVHGRLA